MGTQTRITPCHKVQKGPKPARKSRQSHDKYCYRGTRSPVLDQGGGGPAAWLEALSSKSLKALYPSRSKPLRRRSPMTTTLVTVLAGY
jgi:hypothetical protein